MSLTYGINSGTCVHAVARVGETHSELWACSSDVSAGLFPRLLARGRWAMDNVRRSCEQKPREAQFYKKRLVGCHVLSLATGFNKPLLYLRARVRLVRTKNKVSPQKAFVGRSSHLALNTQHVDHPFPSVLPVVLGPPSQQARL